MRILSVSLEQSQLKRPDILDWLVTPQNNAGVNHERYWLLNPNVSIVNTHQEYEVDKLTAFFHMCIMHDYQLVMITK